MKFIKNVNAKKSFQDILMQKNMKKIAFGAYIMQFSGKS